MQAVIGILMSLFDITNVMSNVITIREFQSKCMSMIVIVSSNLYHIWHEAVFYFYMYYIIYSSLWPCYSLWYLNTGLFFYPLRF